MIQTFSPLFIVGCQRSGSTMLGAMLGAHPSVICLPEAQFIGEFLPEEPDETVDPALLLERIEAHWRFRLWDFRLDGTRPAAGEIAPNFAATVEWLARRFALKEDRSGAVLWVEQQPGHAKRAWHLARIFPEARFVHIVRDGRAVAASLMRCAWGPNRILAAAKFWQERVALGLALEVGLGPARVLRVAYESLLVEPQLTMRLVTAFLDLSFDKRMLRPTGLRLPDFTQADHALVGGALVTDRLGAWQEELSAREIEIFEAQTGDLLPLLGYPLRCGAHPSPATGSEKIWLMLADHLQRGINGWRFARRRQRHKERRRFQVISPHRQPA